MNNRVEFLDFLRGIAALMVFIGHLFVLFPDFIFIGNINFFSRGVQLFYLVSGYTIFIIYDEKINNKNDLIGFMVKRFFRIAPLFFILIPVYYYFNGLSLDKNIDIGLSDAMHILLHYTFLFGFAPETMVSIIPQAWSIFVEVVFYIIFAFFSIIFKKHYTCLHLVLFFIIIHFITVLISNILYKENIFMKDFLFFSPLYQLFIFFIGGLLVRIKFKPNIYIILLIGFSLIFIKYNFLNVLASVLFFSLMILYFNNHNVRFSKIILFFGKISYSMYLTHMLVIEVVTKLLYGANSFVLFFIIFNIVIFLSYITYLFIEFPFIKLGRKVIKRKLYEF